MSWNYRIIRRTIGETESFEVHEVFYRSDGTVEAWTENPIIPTGETLEELKQDFSRQLLAFESPVLDHDRLMQEIGEKG